MAMDRVALVGGPRALAKATSLGAAQAAAPARAPQGDRLALSQAKPLAQSPPPTKAAEPISPKRAAFWGAVAGFVGAPVALGLLGLMAQPFSLGLSPAVFGIASGLCGPFFAGLGWCLAKMQASEAKKRAAQAA